MEYLAGIKGLVVGIVCWAATIVLMPPPACNGSCYGSTFYPFIGGYLFIVVLILAFQGRIPIWDNDPSR